MAFYGLPLPHTLVQVTAGVPTLLPEGVKFEMHTLPVNYSNNLCTNFLVFFLEIKFLEDGFQWAKRVVE